ncbi:unnamed protein product [Prorocentrum cordatum]|uniref:Uncharacterized protein n=1 Tax=Prorocentrum cordatum TaxID=2364126 RepID=A0ABN9XLN8_9DINO|nr:unnamed protein product [Polarella glacialis]
MGSSTRERSACATRTRAAAFAASYVVVFLVGLVQNHPPNIIHVAYSEYFGAQMPQEGSLWASLSSPFPKPRGPKVAHRSATFEVEALGEWRTSTLNSFGAGSGANLCVSSNESLKADCLSKNAAVSAKLRESGPLTRTASGYNFGDVVMILDNRIVSVSTVSMGYERLYQSARLRSCQVFFGVSNQQDPADAFVIMDMLGRVQPDLVIELGTAGGGSAFFYARIMREYNPSARILIRETQQADLEQCR